MKKVLAILLAAIMLMSCAAATAEGTYGINPPLTHAQYGELNVETVVNLLKKAGVPEEAMPMTSTILSFLDSFGVKEVTTENASQWQVFVKDTCVADLAMANEDGKIVLSTSLLPSYTVTLSMESITELFQQVIEKLLEATVSVLDENKDVLNNIISTFSKVDFETMDKNYAEYAKEFTENFLSSYTLGEAEQGEYTFAENGVVFNTKQSFEVDIKAIVDATAELVNKKLKDDNALALAGAFNKLGVNINLPTEVSAEEIKAENLPQVNGAVYTVADKDGKPASSDKAIVVECAEAGAKEPAITIAIYTADNNCVVAIEQPAENTKIAFSAESVVENLSNIKYTHTRGDDYFAVDCDVVSSDGGVMIIRNLYFMDPENPILTGYETVTPGGELTVPLYSEDKAVISMEEMSQDKDGGSFISLTMDLMFNGMPGLINNLRKVMPEEVITLLSAGAVTADE